VANSFIGGGNRRKPPNCRKSLTHNVVSVSEEKNFKNQPIRNKSCLWWPCLLTDRDEMRIIYRGPSIDASSIFRVRVINVDDTVVSTTF
jgi:hypothetical protein